MSAYILSDKHISTMAQLLMPIEHVQAFADKLKHINITSVNYRYDDNTRKTKCKLVTLDECINISMDDLYALYRCWNYQACEGNLLDYQIMQEFLQYKFMRLGYPKDYETKSNLWSI